MNTKTTFSIMAFAIFASTMALVLNNSVAFAKITEVPTGSENPAGKAAPGQQPEAKGKGQTQFTENQNPAGKAPPGQN
jgi:hypothetical protein